VTKYWMIRMPAKAAIQYQTLNWVCLLTQH
jgi:hypothetical protein